MIVIDIPKNFSDDPGARNYSDGPKSGEEFYDVLLKPKFKEALEAGVRLKIILDGSSGYASSFLNESFSLLGNEFGADVVWNRLIIVSEEIPKYSKKIKDSVYEKR
ncbi:STAS-like domain-containing protein [Marinifilum flexuosum]|uniref:STAS-like domain-containing protein n=1 Tax=Marinifilum flexuosum TaxID=1117708 RepID=UPI0024950B49|nr:STAS-like domain-containing protein [Marinifilum flexuosum]